MRTFLRRLAAHGATAKGVGAYQYQLRATVRAASRITGSPVDVAGLFRDPLLLGRALIDDRSTDGPRLSKWTLAQRRSAIRSFANLMRPELLALLGAEPAIVVDRALRLVAERIGGGYRLTGGVPRRRGGRAPNPEEISTVRRSLADAPGFAGYRNRSFFGILVSTGCRVNALRQLDGRDCVVLPNGRVRLYLHEKGKAECREVELSATCVDDLHDYMEAFNRIAASRLWRTRTRLGEPGAIWRNAFGRRWGYSAVLQTLRGACLTARVPPFAPHAMRRAFATDAASQLPRHVVAQAGGWRGLDRLDDHYVQARDPTIWEKLNRSGEHAVGAESEERLTDAAAVIV
jgi:integrase